MYHIVPPDDPPVTILGPSTEAPPNPAFAFAVRLHQVTPRVFVTQALILINVLVFVAMLIGGVPIFDPSPPVLVKWGANFGPETIGHGQWWRLLTSTFLHIGLIHIAFNMAVLFQIGSFVERLLGNAGFLILYIASGLAGSCVSMAVHPQIVCAGASGAIFGLYGGLLGFLLLQNDNSIPSETVRSLQRGAMVFIGYNVIFGFARAGTDIAAHGGGLIMGFLCGMVLSTSLAVDPRPQRLRRNALVAAGASLLVVGSAIALPRPVDIVDEIKHFTLTETTTSAAYSAALKKANLQDQLPVAIAIENDILPACKAERDRLASLKGLATRQQMVVSTMVRYMDRRREAWEMFARAIRNRNPALLLEAQKTHEQAQFILRQMTDEARKRR
ncbi:MAG: rhomboid family intramembrane serine protease [Acidobacteriaceae bacterium]|nr:rhomboid family intramembrane serine protease [Acidobacteriaceae bacterium]